MQFLKILLKTLWVGCCGAIGAGIGSVLIGFQFHSTSLTIVGAVVGAGLGALFGSFISLGDILFSSYWTD